jgi:hypothetical protein
MKTYTEADVRQLLKKMARESYNQGDFYSAGGRLMFEATIAIILEDSFNAVLDAREDAAKRGSREESADLKYRMEAEG